MIQPHLFYFQMYWNHKFQDLWWWFQKWQGPHSSWRKGSPVAQSLTGVKLPFCDSTDDCMFSCHVRCQFVFRSVASKFTDIRWPLLRFFISFRLVSIRQLTGLTFCSARGIRVWYFQGPKPQGTQMDCCRTVLRWKFAKKQLSSIGIGELTVTSRQFLGHHSPDPGNWVFVHQVATSVWG